MFKGRGKVCSAGQIERIENENVPAFLKWHFSDNITASRITTAHLHNPVPFVLFVSAGIYSDSIQDLNNKQKNKIKNFAPNKKKGMCNLLTETMAKQLKMVMSTQVRMVLRVGVTQHCLTSALSTPNGQRLQMCHTKSFALCKLHSRCWCAAEACVCPCSCFHCPRRPACKCSCD